ncbi:MAG: TatD DNase family protein [Candidatus Dependentiae bacterium]|nr:TatD DNase family protein [Candidatus Dependentiae bacterium]
MMIDTHCHLNIMADKKPEELLRSEHFPAIEQFLREAAASNLSYLITVGTSIPESQNCVALAERYQLPPIVKATIGVHPCDITQPIEEIIRELEAIISSPAGKCVVAIGEIGLDYYHQPYDKELQAQVFIAQLELAKKHRLPVVIHIRDAGVDALAILEKYKSDLCGVIHCFSLDLAAAERVISWGWYIGIDGPITYPKNHHLRFVVATVPLSGIMLETDAPFLPPQHLRGKRNSPANLGIIAQAIADARGVALVEVVTQTTKNAQALFRL